MKCPKCDATDIHIQERGFDAGKAVAGGLLGSLLGSAGALAGGLLAGTASQKDLACTCLKCGHRFKPGDPPARDAYWW